MESSVIADLIMKGGVYSGIEGNTCEVVYKAMTGLVPLPEGLSKDTLYTALVEREKILSTAVGRGIALPHARVPIIKNISDQEICVAYLENPIRMGAPDERNVFVMFLLLTANSQMHLDILGQLVTLFKRPSFYSLLEKRADKNALIEEIKRL